MEESIPTYYKYETQDDCHKKRWKNNSKWNSIEKDKFVKFPSPYLLCFRPKLYTLGIAGERDLQNNKLQR